MRAAGYGREIREAPVSALDVALLDGSLVRVFSRVGQVSAPLV
ncbi:MAG: hypothetical protein V7646_823 [Pseudonocardia sp.]|jgi:hypothetical protein